MVCLPDHSESCHHQCLKAVCGLLGYLKGSASELLDGTLKLRHCTEVFTMRFPTFGHYPGLVLGMMKVSLLLLVISWIQVVTWVAGSGIPGRHVPSDSSHVIPDPGHPTPRRWKRLRPPSSEGVDHWCKNVQLSGGKIMIRELCVSTSGTSGCCGDEL